MMNSVLVSFVVIAIVFVLTQLYITFAKPETQSYELIRNEKDFEVRYYPEATMATIISSAKSFRELGSPGFKKLASYIFGGNDSNTKLAMTSPVHMDINSDKSTMSFVLPAEYKVADLPIPNDQSVVINMSKPEYVAVIKFSGFATDEVIKAQKQKLERALKLYSITYYGNFRFLGYNAPYQIFDRRNEIIVSVHRSEI